eukprot:2158948-Rhodomonas_salina.1
MDCLSCCRSSAAKAKKTDETGKDNPPDLEGGEGGDDWEFESWDNKPKPAVQAVPPPVLQRLDDFDGMAPTTPKEEVAEPDFFGALGLQPTYEPPKKAAVKKQVASSLQLGLDDEDVDVDGWET